MQALSDRSRLESWKEIASYLNRGIRTVERWEREEGLPVHRLQGGVYAIPAELDRWRDERTRLAAPAPLAPEQPARARKAIDSIAVLPLENAGADAAADYLGDGITETLIDTLAPLPELRVLARNTVFRYKGQQIDPRALNRELRVRAVLTGRVQQLGDRVVVRAELVDTDDGSQIWGAQFSRPAADAFLLQEGLATEIANSVRLRLTRADRDHLTHRHTDSGRAYDAYLRGRFEFNKRTHDGFERAIEHLQQAIDEDRDYALAHAGLAEVYTVSGSAGYTTFRRDAVARARRAAERAVEIDPALAEAHAALAFVRFRLDWDWPRSEDAFQRSLELNQGRASTHHWYALYLTARGRLNEALAAIGRAQTLDPLSSIINTAAGRILHFARRYDEAIALFRRTLDIDPAFMQARLDLGMTQGAQGSYDNAIKEFEEHMSATAGRSVMLGVLGYLYARAGREEAFRVLNDLQCRVADGTASPFDVALTVAGLDRAEETVDWLERAYAERANPLVYLAVEPMFDRVRHHPRFQSLVARMELQPRR